MWFAGVDVGSISAESVIVDEEGRVVGQAIGATGADSAAAAGRTFAEALEQAGLEPSQIGRVVSTGYGRERVSFAHDKITEITCHGRGALHLFPEARTVIDIGGQDSKAIRVDERGRVMSFQMNDKCAAGTGRFLEVMARILGLELGELGEMSARSRNPVTLASACTVWAQADVIQHLNDKVPVEDIAAGVNQAMAARMAILANSIGIEQDVCMTGGVAKNQGVLAALEKQLGTRIRRPKRHDPQLAGAIGAALFAQERLNGGPT